MNTRITKQRKIILNHLKSVKTHPSAEMVYGDVVKDEPKITLATVYRNLNLLADQMLITRLEINGEFRYDADMEFHQHLICNQCGKIKDVFQKEISEHALNKLETNNFDVSSVKIIFEGICDSCKKEK